MTTKRLISGTARLALALGALAAVTGVAALAVLHGRGYELVAVRGASMGASLPLGSLVLAERLPAVEVERGDVVLVRQPTLGGRAATPFLHRVVALDRDGAQLVAETKGDANARRDPTPYILPREVVRVRAHVPHAGYAAAAAAGPYGRMTLLSLLVSLLTFMALRRLLRGPRPEPRAAPAEETEPVAAPAVTQGYR